MYTLRMPAIMIIDLFVRLCNQTLSGDQAELTLKPSVLREADMCAILV